MQKSTSNLILLSVNVPLLLCYRMVAVAVAQNQITWNEYFWHNLQNKRRNVNLSALPLFLVFFVFFVFMFFKSCPWAVKCQSIMYKHWCPFIYSSDTLSSSAPLFLITRRTKVRMFWSGIYLCEIYSEIRKSIQFSNALALHGHEWRGSGRALLQH